MFDDWRGPPAYTGYDITGKLEESGYAEHGRHMPDASQEDAATRPRGSSLSATTFRQPPHHQAEARRASYRGRGPRDYARSDDRIAEDIHHRLAADPDVDASDIEFSVEKGWVQLRGTVATRGEKYRAESLAADCQGVADVHNAIKARGARESYGFQDKRGRVGQRQ